jgi:hypothetical protein
LESVKECAMTHSEDLGWDEEESNLSELNFDNFLIEHFDEEEEA